MLLSICIGGYYLLITKPVQNAIATHMLSVLSKRTNTQISASSVYIKSLRKLEIKDLYVEDQNNDTLLYSPRIIAEIDSINIKDKFFSLGTFYLEQPVVNISQNADSIYNFMFLVDSLKKNGVPKQDTIINSESIRWELAFNDITLNQGRISFAPLYMKRALINELDFEAYANKNKIEIENLSFKMDSGINLHNTSALLMLKKDAVELSMLSAETDNSKIDFRDLYISKTGDKIGKSNLKFNAQSNNSYISTKDLNYFIPQLNTLDNTLIVDGKLGGDLSHFSGQNLRLALSPAADIVFDFDIKNIENIHESEFYLLFHNLDVNVSKIIDIYENIFPESTQNLEQYSHVKTISYEGEFSGNTDKIKMLGKIKSDYGQIYTNGSLGLNDSLKLNYYNGRIVTLGFNLGGFLQQENIGSVAGEAQVKGNANSKGIIESYFDGELTKIGLKGYEYQNIHFNGEVLRRYFNGNLSIDDPNLQLDFVGEVDMYDVVNPEFNYTLTLDTVDFAALNLVSDYKKLALKLNIDSKLMGKTIDNLNGYINFDSIFIATEHGEFFTDSIEIKFKPLDAMPSIILNSEYINGLVLGSYNFSKIMGYLNQSLKKHIKYLPQKFNDPITSRVNNFAFSIGVADLSKITKVLDLPWRNNGFSMFDGKINTHNDEYDMNIHIPYITTHAQYLDSISLNIKNNQKAFISHINVGDVLFSNERQINEINLDLTIQNDTIKFSNSWDNKDEEKYSGDFNSKIWLRPYGNDLETIIAIQPSEFVFSDSLWTLNQHKIYVRPSNILVDNLRLEKGSSFFMLDGTASKYAEDTLSLKMNQFDINSISHFLRVKNFDFSGILSGKAEIYSTLQSPIFAADIQIDNTIVNNSYWGNIAGNSSWDAKEQELKLYLNSESENTNEDLFIIGGSYFPTNDSLDVNAYLDNFEIGFLQGFLKKTLDDIDGTASGKLKAVGSIKNPELYGGLKVNDGQFRIDYLSSKFYINDTIYFDNNRFVFDQTTVTDQEKNIAKVSGDITHTNYRNMMVDIVIESNRFLAMNTNIDENEYFYGDIYYGGAITIKSNNKSTTIGSRARTMRGSILTVPLSPISTANKNNFIKYINNNIVEEVEVEESRSAIFMKSTQEKPKRKLIIDMNFDVTPDATIRLEFNPTTGEVIEAIGQGSLNVKFQQGIPFQLFGDYVINKGKYRFSLEQIFNKNLEINPGSSLQWSGRPGEAIMDIEAQYETNASLYNLMPDAISSSSKNRRVPVNVKLFMKKSLAKPDITFDIELPNTDRETQQSVSNIINNDEEMSRQVLSLMIMNSFYTPEYYTGSAQSGAQLSNAAAVTVSEFLSNQLSKWMSQISDKFDLGVSYHPEQEIIGEGYTPDEVGVIISTQFFNDRLTVNGNVGYQNYNETTKPPNVNSNFVGEFDVELKLNESLKLKAYSHQNDDIFYENSNMKYGAGVAYEKSYVNLRDWLSSTLEERRKNKELRIENRKKREEKRKRIARKKNNEEEKNNAF